MDHDEFMSQEIFWIHFIWRFWVQKSVLSGPVKNHRWEILRFVLFHEGLQVNKFMFYLLSLRSWSFTLFSWGMQIHNAEDMQCMDTFTIILIHPSSLAWPIYTVCGAHELGQHLFLECRPSMSNIYSPSSQHNAEEWA